ncbi:MAG: YkgJ family cysteine cluster protein [Syntrophorhabdus sp.]
MKSDSDQEVVCRRCGNCCHVDVAAYVSLEDIERWERQGRHDIIAHIRANNITWSRDRVINKFGSDINTCRMSCVYLQWYDSSASCAIYETRTSVCRSYVPGATRLCPQFGRNAGSIP